MDKTLKVNLHLLKDINLSDECKVYTIITMLHAREISLGKAKELFEEIGVFSRSWIAIDADVTNIFEETYSSMTDQ